jgi:hypothetical protein
LLGTPRSAMEEGSDVDIGRLAAGGRIRFVSDKYPSRGCIVGEKPSIAIWTAIKLSRRHRLSPTAYLRPEGFGHQAAARLG